MSKDIRSFFISSTGSSQTKSVTKDKPRKKHVVSSDEDERKNSSPSKSRKTKTASIKNTDINGRKSHSKKRTIVSSDEEDNVDSHAKTKKAKVLNGSKTESIEKKLEVVEDVRAMFSKTPAKRIDAPKITRKTNVEKPVETTKKPLSNCLEDDDFDATLNQLDTSQYEDEYLASINNEMDPPFFKKKKENNTESRNSKKEEKNDSKVKRTVNEEKEKEKHTLDKNKESNTDKKTSPADKNKSKEKIDKEKSSKNNSETNHENEKEKSDKHHSETNQNVKDKKKSKEVDYNDIIEKKVEKKKQHAILYQSYLNRGGARNPGSKEIPEGAEQCLANLSFLITGVLDSLERDEAEGIITKYGGKILHSVSKKLNYIIIGEEPGPSKLAKAESLHIKTLSEDGLLELIRTRPAGVNNSKKLTADSDTSHKRKRDDSSNREISESSDKAKKNKHESPPKDNQKSPEKANKSKAHSSPTKEHKSIEKTEKKEDSPSHKKDHKSPEKSIEKNSLPRDENKTSDKVESKSDIPQAQSSKSDLNKINTSGDALVEKYRPKELKQIIGQTGDKSNAKKLHFWLTNWHKNHGKDAKGTKPKFSYKDDTGTIYKAALLSGPPGIGKTTTAYVVCAQLGYEVLEFNASDTRSKKLLQEEIAGILSNKTVRSFLTNAPEKKKDPPKHVLLMDEVDGMAGNEDRGGMQELIAFIKSTEVPIICICNDRMSQKIKTLANYTFDLRFQKPRLEQIRAAMMSICYKEGITVSPPELTAIIQSTNQDIRQVINHVAMLSAKSQTDKESHEKTKYKNLKLGPWDVVKKVFSADEHKNMSIHDKSDLFFHDYNIAALFVEENYLSVTPSGPRNELFDKLAKCSDSLAIGDMIENAIRGNQAWALLPVQACFSSVIPGTVMSGFINSQINFPSWLGRNSKRSKCDRLLQDITVHARITTGASKEAINLDYLKMLVDSIVRPLAVEGTEGVEKAVDVMNKYHLSREDLDSLIELTKWPHTRDPMQSVDSKTKTAFTKAYNKSALFHSATTMKKKSSRVTEDDELMGSDEEPTSDGDDEDNDKIGNDKLIKAKASKANTSKAAPSDSKGKGKAKGAVKSSSTRGRKK